MDIWFPVFEDEIEISSSGLKCPRRDHCIVSKHWELNTQSCSCISQKSGNFLYCWS